MNIAFIEHPQHDIDCQKRRNNQEGLGGKRSLEGLHRSGKHAPNGCRHADILLRLADGLNRIAQGDPRRQIESDCHGGELPVVVYGQRRNPLFEMGHGAERNHLAGAGVDVNVVERLRVLPELRRDFHHHVILVERGVHRRDLGLAEGAVESGIHQLGCDSEPGRRLAVIDQPGLQAAILLVRVHVGEFRSFLIWATTTGPHSNQVVHAVGPKRVLILRVRLLPANFQTLSRPTDTPRSRAHC